MGDKGTGGSCRQAGSRLGDLGRTDTGPRPRLGRQLPLGLLSFYSWKPVPSPALDYRVGHGHYGPSCSPHGCDGGSPGSVTWVPSVFNLMLLLWLLPGEEKEEEEEEGEEEGSLIPVARCCRRAPLPLSCGTRETNCLSLPGTKGVPRR